RELYEILTFKNFHYFYVFQYFKDMNLTAYLKELISAGITKRR
ncbi:hypothetical protein M2326_003566, partial [Flavobacterium sp. 7A]|nr:hypothetical protein [Flavobacterium sp. 7A]